MCRCRRVHQNWFVGRHASHRSGNEYCNVRQKTRTTTIYTIEHNRLKRLKSYKAWFFKAFVSFCLRQGHSFSGANLSKYVQRCENCFDKRSQNFSDTICMKTEKTDAGVGGAFFVFGAFERTNGYTVAKI